VCVGREIEWQTLGNEAIDQEWFSQTRLKEQSFASFAYEFISYDLILDGWLEMTPQPTEAELNYLEHDEPLMRALLSECEEAALAEGNHQVLPLITKARQFVDAYKRALLYRFEQCGIT